MSTPIAGIRYYYNVSSKFWEYPGRESLAGEVDLFELEATKPNAFNSGPRLRRDQLTVWNGDLVVTTPGDVISGYLVLGRIRVRALGCTVEDNIVENQTVVGSATDVIDTSNTAARNTIVRFNEVSSAAAPSPYINGIGPRSTTAYRNYIHDVVDGASLHDLTGNNDPQVFQGNYITQTFYITPNPAQSDNQTHDDGIQLQGGPSNVLIQGNTINAVNSPRSTNGGRSHGRSLSAIMLNTNPSRTASNVQILGNWIDGGTDQINGRGTNGGTIQIKRNKFGRNKGGYAITNLLTGATVWDVPITGADANVFEDNGAPLTTGLIESGTIRRYS